MEWNIQARAHVCQACQKPFEDEEQFHTLLFDASIGYERQDLCEPCWKQQNLLPAGNQKKLISHWQTVFTPPPAAPPDAIQKETAETLLRRLIEEGDPVHAPARFILAVMMERKRIFKAKAHLHQANQRVLVYEHARTGELFNIPDPDLHLDQLEEVQRNVLTLLEQGLPQREPAAPPPGAIDVVAVPVTGELPLEKSEA